MRRPLLLALLALTLSACGGSAGSDANPNEALSQTAAKLGDIDSGVLQVKLLVDPREEGGDFGFELSGPFELGKDGDLPVAEIEYTQIADDQRETVTVTSTGEEAFITVDGTAYELSSEQEDRLRSAAPNGDGGGGGGNGLGELKIDDWLSNAKSSGGDDVGGDATDKIEADLDIVAAVNDLMALAGRVTGSGAPIDGAEARLLRDSVRDARIEILTGEKDRLLRRLRITAEFDPQLAEELEELAQAAGAKVEFELEIADPNEPVEVEAPADPRPASELTTSS
jgi:hypothetical protein